MEGGIIVVDEDDDVAKGCGDDCQLVTRMAAQCHGAAVPLVSGNVGSYNLK